MEAYITQKVLLYLFIVVVTLISSLAIKREKYELLFVCIAFLWFGLLLGMRDHSVGTDTINYILTASESSRKEVKFKDIGYEYLIIIISKLGISKYLLIIMSFLYLYPLYRIFKSKLVTHKIQLLYVFFSFFFVYALGINIMRQGVAISFMLLAAVYWTETKRRKSILVAIIATSFHLSTIIMMVVFAISYHIKTINRPLTFYIICTIISFFGADIINLLLTIPEFSEISGNRLDIYQSAGNLSNIYNKSYEIGFRKDFFLFNSIFAALFVYSAKRKTFSDDIWISALNAYLILSGVFFLSFQIPYSDRFGVMSWILIPFLFTKMINYLPRPYLKLILLLPFTIYAIFTKEEIEKLL